MNNNVKDNWRYFKLNLFKNGFLPFIFRVSHLVFTIPNRLHINLEIVRLISSNALLLSSITFNWLLPNCFFFNTFCFFMLFCITVVLLIVVYSFTIVETFFDTKISERKRENVFCRWIIVKCFSWTWVLVEIFHKSEFYWVYFSNVYFIEEFFQWYIFVKSFPQKESRKSFFSKTVCWRILHSYSRDFSLNCLNY